MRKSKQIGHKSCRRETRIDEAMLQVKGACERVHMPGFMEVHPCSKNGILTHRMIGAVGGDYSVEIR